MKTKSTGKIWHMSGHERNGLLLFFLLSVISILVIKNLNSEQTPVIIHPMSGYTEDKNTETAKQSNRHWKKRANYATHKNTPLLSGNRHRFKFNPNTISADSFRLLGFSQFTTNNLQKYRQKGGVIKSIEQFKNLYGIDTALVQDLSREIYFGQQKTTEHKIIPEDQKAIDDSMIPSSQKARPDEKPIQVVELNQADSQALVSIRGIGPHYAKKIIKMKKKLGGYVRPHQLLECKVLPDSVFRKIEKFMVADPGKMEKIDINRADYKTLIQHPYLKENLVKVILHYRENHGAFTSLDQLKNIKILDRETYEKLIPHFVIHSQ